VPRLPDSGAFTDLAARLRGLSTTVAGQRSLASTTKQATVWVSPAADRARSRWSRADGHAGTAADELRAAAGHLDRLASAVDELRALMAAARRRAQEELQDAARSAASGGQGLPQGVVQAELRGLPPAEDPYWSTQVAVPSAPVPPLPGVRGPGDPGPTAPPGVVVTTPADTRALAGVWHTAGLQVGTGRASAATSASALPLPTLDAYSLPGGRTGTLLEAVLGPAGHAARAATAYESASEEAVAAANAIDGLGLVPMGAVGTGESAAQTLLDAFAALDTAAQGGEPDGVVSLEDLQAAAADEGLSAQVRAAAQQMLDDPELFGLVQDMDEGATPGLRDGKIRAAALADFVGVRAATETVYDAFARLVRLSGSTQDVVTVEGLARAAEDPTVPRDVRDAARWLLAHPQAVRVLGTPPSASGTTDFHPTLFTRDDAIRVLVNGHAFDGRPADAQRFLDTLPLAEDGGRGYPLGHITDKGAQSLANAALIAARGDLSEQVSAIAHLPETDGGVRNALISAMYARMGAQMDVVANGDLPAGELLADPTRPGHSGANWMVIAPWASNGVRDPITGRFRAAGVVPAPYGARQAAADGNQWIFNDIGGRYAAFLEMYQDGGRPDAAQLERFFDRGFQDGDAQIRSAFAAYAEVPVTQDPVRRQQLMYQGNVLIAVHEQAGAQPWLERVSVGPDAIATEFVELEIGSRTVQVNRDLSELDTPNNLLVGRPLLDLDPGAADPHVLAPNALAGVSLGHIDGVQDLDSAFPLTLAEMAERGGTSTRPVLVPGSPFPAQMPVAADPDSRTGTAAPAWTDRDERMWTIVKLFEQTHTEAALYDTSGIFVGFDQPLNGWLDPATGLRP